VGFVDEDPPPLHESLGGVPVFPESSGLMSAAAASEATRVILAFSRQPAEATLEAIRLGRRGGLAVSVVPRYFEITPPHARVTEVSGMPLLSLGNAGPSIGGRIAKRAMDLTLALGALFIMAPLLLVIAVAIKATSRGPVFFRQERLGREGRAFRIWKFRTMVQDAESMRFSMAHLNEMVEAGPLFKIKRDPRVTPVGRFLRRTSIDELPQLLNVIMGEMSLVGPRPFVTHEAMQMMDGWHARRLDLTPGITGVWQVQGRNDVPYQEMVRLDYLYVTNWSLWWDLRLILQTIPAMISGRGAS
jgi:exopolysaccharide biosynthesis polyprenyl glycosylphosphotransferase